MNRCRGKEGVARVCARGDRLKGLAFVLVLCLAGGVGTDISSAGAVGDEGMEFSIELRSSEVEVLREQGPMARNLGPGWGVVGPEEALPLPARVIYREIPAGMRVTGCSVVSSEDERFTWDMNEPGTPGLEGVASPTAPAEYTGEGNLAGRRMASIVFRPLTVSDEGGFVLHRRVRVRLKLASAVEPEPTVVSRRASGEISRVRDRMVRALPGMDTGGERLFLDESGPAGPVPQGEGEFLLFRPGDYPSLDGSVVEYLIITTSEMESEFQRLADWRTRRGHPAVVRTISWIESNYPGGVDRADKIRLMIRDAYVNWGTQWVLLAADTEYIPVRLAHIVYYFYPNGEDLACDLFYASLDGTWDGDGDGIFGEGYQVEGAAGDSVDLFPEVFLGRAPVSTVGEAQVFIDKTMRYEDPDSLGYQDRALFAGEVLFPYLWYGDPGTIELNGCDIAHQAGAYVPAGWDTTYLCQYPDDDLGPDTLLAALNEGYGLVTVVDHGDPFKIRVTGDEFLLASDFASLTNDGEYFVVNYSNCNTSMFDLECLNESMILNAGGGAIAAVAPSRLAFPNVARHYQGEFYRAFFETDAYTLGEVYSLSRIPFAGFAFQDGPWRWTHLSYVLLGDPALSLWAAVPDTQVVTHSGSMSLGDTAYVVDVTSDGSPLHGALVVLWKEDTGEYARGRTDASGSVTLPFYPGSLGDVRLDVTHPTHLPVADTVTVVAGSGVVYVSGISIDDDGTGLSSGNNDGRPDAGERIELGVTLTNGSGAGVTGVTADLSLLAGGEFDASLAVDGTQVPGLVFLGRDGEHPASLPFTVGLDASVTEGRPSYTAAASDDSTSDPSDTTGVDVFGRCYLWEDGSGWHLRAAGGLETHSFAGTLSTDGALHRIQPFDLESADFYSADSQTVYFAFAVDSTNAEDGLDFIWADSLYLDILDGTEDYGDIGSGSEASRTFLVDIPSGTPGGQVGRFDLVATANEGSWNDGVRLEVTRAELVDLFHSVDDSTYTGDADGTAEVGETVALLCHLWNSGSGSAEGVQGTLRALAGGTVTDSLDSFGTVAPGSLVVGQGGMVLTLDALPLTLELELRDSYGTTWVEQFDLDGPGVLTGLIGRYPSTAREGTIELGWDPAPEADLLGYLIYRSDSLGGTSQLLGERTMERTSYFRDEEAQAGSTYYYQVAAVDSVGTRGPLSSVAGLLSTPPYQGSFPKQTGDVIWSSPLMVDLMEDRAGDLELFCGSKDHYAYGWDHTGASLPGWRRWTGDQVWTSPSAGDLDGDGEMEVCFGSDDFNVYVWNADGTGMLNPDGLFAATEGFVRSSPALADIDLDDSLEVIFGSYDSKFYVFDSDGTGYLQPDGLFALLNEGILASSPTVADVDGDYYPEIFITTMGLAPFTGKIFAFNHDGTGLTFWTGEFKLLPGSLWSSVSIGDVDLDGKQEIVVGCFNGAVYVMGPTSQMKPGWPKWTGEAVWSSPALGDLDGDDDLEIVVGSADYFIHAWHHDGTVVAGWPDSTGYEVLGSPILVDVDNDSLPEVVIGSADGLLYALDGDGTLLPGWPIRTGDDIYGGPAAGDLDGDGDLEIAVGSYDGRVHVFDLNTPCNDSANDWPMFAHDAYRSGWYHRFEQETGVSEGERDLHLPKVTALGQNAPNPFNPRTTIKYQLRQEGPVELEVYDVTGRRVRTLVTGEQPAGYHQVIWDGRDDSGRPTASGMYLYRLVTEERSFARKMVMLR